MKNLRLQYFKKNIDRICERDALELRSFIAQNYIVENFEKLTQFIGVKPGEEVDRNLSKTDINVGVEMFMFLNSCPSFHEKLYWKAMYGPKSRIVMLASNIIKKANDDFKIKANLIFARISQVLGFQHITYKNGKELRTNSLELNVKDEELLQTVSNHPVHILNNEGGFSPSSFIPFCSFGDEFIGVRVNQSDVPVCNIFKPTIYFDQLCYETDLQELKSRNIKRLEDQLEIGLTLILDYNEERQINYNDISKDVKKNSLYHHDESFSIYLDTISIEFSLKGFYSDMVSFRSCEAFWRRSIQSSQYERDKSYRFFLDT